MKSYKSLVQADSSRTQTDMDVDDEFAELDAPTTSSSRDPFDDFINAAKSDDECIQYWTMRLPPPNAINITPLQALARMALDFLSAAATSTDVERLFSHSGLVVAKRRYNLTPNNIRQSTVLGNWLGIDGLVPMKAVLQKLNMKYGKRGEDQSEEWSETDEDDVLTT